MSLEPEEIEALASMYAATIANKRRKYRKKCPHCLQMFEGISKAKYCGNRCRQAAWRARTPDYKPNRGKYKDRERLKRFLERQEKAATKVQEDMALGEKLRKIR